MLTAEGSKQAAILEAEGMRDSQVARATGEQKARIMNAEAEAQARVRVAQAEAEAIRLVTAALGRTDPVAYLMGMRYIEALQAMADGNAEKIVYLPYEASGLMASLGGIKELFAGAAPAAAPAPTRRAVDVVPPIVAAPTTSDGA